MREFFDFLFEREAGGEAQGSNLRLELRPAHPQWREAELYPPEGGQLAPPNWTFRTGDARRWFPLDPDGLARATEHALALAPRAHVYFGVLPRIGESGKGADVPAAGCLWCDVDGGTEGVEGTIRLLDAATEAGKVERIPKPHFEIISGNGLHLYWRLRDPVRFDGRESDEARRRFKELLQRLCFAIGGESQKGIAHADTARCDLASILRVPGTLNHKLQGNPKPVTVRAFRPDLEPLTATAWSARLPPLPEAFREKFREDNAVSLRKDHHHETRSERETKRLRQETRLLPGKAKRLLDTPHPNGTKHEALRQLLFIARSFCGYDELALELLARTLVERNPPWDESHWRRLVKDTMSRC